MVTKTQKIPQPQILHQLVERFFSGEGRSSAASSHWEHYLQRVVNRGDGEIDLSGVGFGDYFGKHWVHRCFDWATVQGYLRQLERAPQIREQFRHLAVLEVPLSYDGFRQCAIVDLIVDSLKRQSLTVNQVCLIGDGYGILTALLKKNLPRAKFTNIDLGKVLTFQNSFLQSHFHDSDFWLHSAASQEFQRAREFKFIPAEDVKNCQLGTDLFDLVINVASMQEMDPKWIEFYFGLIRGAVKEDNLFYCCNRLHKKLPAGEVTEVYNYPWQAEDKVYFEEEAPFYKWFFQLRATEVGGRVWGLPVPFLRKFDGPLHHRLVRMARGQ